MQMTEFQLNVLDGEFQVDRKSDKRSLIQSVPTVTDKLIITCQVVSGQELYRLMPHSKAV